MTGSRSNSLSGLVCITLLLYLPDELTYQMSPFVSSASSLDARIFVAMPSSDFKKSPYMHAFANIKSNQ